MSNKPTSAKSAPKDFKLNFVLPFLSFALLYSMQTGCRLRQTFDQKSNSNPEGFLIQLNPAQELKRIYWVQNSQNTGQDLCLCTSGSTIIGNNLKNPVCSNATTMCVDFSLFRLKFDELSDFKQILATRNADLTSIKNEIYFLKEGILEVEEDLALVEKNQKTKSPDQSQGIEQTRQDQLMEVLKTSKLQLEKKTTAKSESKSELDFVIANQSSLAGASKQVTELLLTEGRNFNLGTWSSSGPNNSILPFVSKMVFDASNRAFAEQQTPPTDLANTPLQDVFKNYTVEFNLRDFDFHPSQFLLIPQKMIVGPHVQGYRTTEVKEGNEQSEAFKTNLMDRRACLLSRAENSENTKKSEKAVSPLTSVESLSDEMASAMLWDKNQLTLVIQCGFVSHVVFSDKTESNAPGKEKEAKKSQFKKNLQSIGLSATAQYGQEKSVFTLGDLFKLIPKTRILYSAKK